MRSKNNKTELLNPEEGEDNMGDAIGKRSKPSACERRLWLHLCTVGLLILVILLILQHEGVSLCVSTLGNQLRLVEEELIQANILHH